MYLFEESSPDVFFRVRVFGGENEGGFAHDEVFGDGTDVAGISGVEYLVSGDEVPVLLEGVFTDKGIAQV